MKPPRGAFYVVLVIANHVQRSRRIDVHRTLVDTGSEHTWIAEAVLRRIGVVAEKKDIRFILANGQTVSREVGFAVIHFQEHFTVDEVVFAREGDLQILGARTLEGLNLSVDPRKKRLVAAGPPPAAAQPSRSRTLAQAHD